MGQPVGMRVTRSDVIRCDVLRTRENKKADTSSHRQKPRRMVPSNRPHRGWIRTSWNGCSTHQEYRQLTAATHGTASRTASANVGNAQPKKAKNMDARPQHQYTSPTHAERPAAAQPERTHPQLDELVHPLHRREPIEAVLRVAVPHEDRHHRPELYERGGLDLSAPAAMEQGRANSNDRNGGGGMALK